MIFEDQKLRQHLDSMGNGWALSFGDPKDHAIAVDAVAISIPLENSPNERLIAYADYGMNGRFHWQIWRDVEWDAAEKVFRGFETRSNDIRQLLPLRIVEKAEYEPEWFSFANCKILTVRRISVRGDLSEYYVQVCRERLST